MNAAPPSRAVYIGSHPAEVSFGMFHPTATRDRPAAAVLFLPPFGWEDLGSFRARRCWAEQLAAHGHPCLRIDLPGSGDSPGSPSDADRVGAWTRGIVASADWIRRESACRRLVVIGIGLGGLLAVQATASGAAVDDLVLWAVPSRGRVLVRELRAFARLNAVDDPEDAAYEPLLERVPDGSFAVSGFLLAAETQAALEALDLAELELPPHPSRRVLLLGRDNIDPDPQLVQTLSNAGAVVTVEPGAGFTGMMAEPQDTQAPWASFSAVEAWLQAQPAAEVAGPTRSVTGRDEAQTRVDGVWLRERALTVEQPTGRLVGVLTEAREAPRHDLAGILLNAGALRRIGPGRLWVDISRQWAARGVPTLRIDLMGIGDADGDVAPYGDTGALYSIGLVDQVIATLDDLVCSGIASRFVLMGLCSGAFWSFHAALRDKRVQAAFLLNPRALYWDETLDSDRVARRISKATDPRTWRRLVHGELSPARGREVLRAAIGRATRQQGGVQAARDLKLNRGLQSLSLDQRIVLAFGGNEPQYEEIERAGLLEQFVRQPNLELVRLPGSDHTLRPLAAQARATAVLNQALERERDLHSRA